MLTLHHAPQSRSSRFIWLLEELGADYEIAYVELERMDGSGARDPGNPHPDGKVPALDHDGTVVTESAAVALYLTDLFPGAGIGPTAGDPRRGPYLTWLAYYAGVIEPVIAIDHAGLGETDILRYTFRGRAQMHARLNDALAGGPYLLGADFTAADILVASVGQWMRQALPAGQLIDSYLERCFARPALARAFARDARPT